MYKRLISGILALSMAFSVLPVSAFAATGDVYSNPACAQELEAENAAETSGLVINNNGYPEGSLAEDGSYTKACSGNGWSYEQSPYADNQWALVITKAFVLLEQDFEFQCPVVFNFTDSVQNFSTRFQYFYGPVYLVNGNLPKSSSCYCRFINTVYHREGTVTLWAAGFYAGLVQSGGDLTLDAFSISNNNGGDAFVQNGGTVTINVRPSSFNAFYGPVVINGGIFTATSTTAHTVIAFRDTVTVNGGTFTVKDGLFLKGIPANTDLPAGSSKFHVKSASAIDRFGLHGLSSSSSTVTEIDYISSYDAVPIALNDTVKTVNGKAATYYDSSYNPWNYTSMQYLKLSKAEAKDGVFSLELAPNITNSEVQIDDTGYPVGTGGGKYSLTGNNWKYEAYTNGASDTGAKGLLTLGTDSYMTTYRFYKDTYFTNGATTDTPIQCDVVLDKSAELMGGIFNGKVTNNSTHDAWDARYNGPVVNNGTIKLSVLTNNVDNQNGTLYGCVLLETATLENAGTIQSSVLAKDFGAPGQKKLSTESGRLTVQLDHVTSSTKYTSIPLTLTSSSPLYFVGKPQFYVTSGTLSNVNGTAVSASNTRDIEGLEWCGYSETTKQYNFIPDGTMDIVLNKDIPDVPEATYKLTVVGADAAPADTSALTEGTLVTLTAYPDDASKTFTEWVVTNAKNKQLTPADLLGADNQPLAEDAFTQRTLTFRMPAYALKVTANTVSSSDPTDPDTPDSGEITPLQNIGNIALVGAAAVGGVVFIYEAAATHYLYTNLPNGAVPATRAELALVLWQAVGKPEPAAPAAYSDVADTDTAKAARWAVEAGLISDKGETTFAPSRRITKIQAIQAWNKLQKRSK